MMKTTLYNKVILYPGIQWVNNFCLCDLLEEAYIAKEDKKFSLGLIQTVH